MEIDRSSFEGQLDTAVANLLPPDIAQVIRNKCADSTLHNLWCELTSYNNHFKNLIASIRSEINVYIGKILDKDETCKTYREYLLGRGKVNTQKVFDEISHDSVILGLVRELSSYGFSEEDIAKMYLISKLTCESSYLSDCIIVLRDTMRQYSEILSGQISQILPES